MRSHPFQQAAEPKGREIQIPLRELVIDDPDRFPVLQPLPKHPYPIGKRNPVQQEPEKKRAFLTSRDRPQALGT